MSGPSSAPAYGGAYGAPGLVQPSAGSGVVVHMHDPVVREEADIGRIGAEFAFKYRARG